MTVITGNAGDYAIQRMRRGVVIVKGNVGKNSCTEIISGTVIITGRLGKNFANKIQINKNKTSLNTLNNQLKDALDLKQKVNNLAKSTKDLQKSMSNLGSKMQGHGFAAAGTTKKDMPNPLPHFLLQHKEQLHSE